MPVLVGRRGQGQGSVISQGAALDLQWRNAMRKLMVPIAQVLMNAVTGEGKSEQKVDVR